MNKKIRSTLYTTSKVIHSRKESYRVSDPQNYLYSDGIYRTKILPEDLPEWFVFGYLCDRHGYISAKGVKHLLYRPNYAFENHLNKDDFLYISYKDEIKQDGYLSPSFPLYKGYDHSVYGGIIVKFVEAAEKYSDYDVSEIKKEIKRKTEWYLERNPKGCSY